MTAQLIPQDLLNTRQRQVLVGLCAGSTNAEIAGDIGLSEKSVKAYVTSIFFALKVRNRVEAVLVALGHRKLES